MALTAGKITIFNVEHNGLNLPLYTETANQNLPDQELFIILPGSGGISSFEKLWSEQGLTHGRTIAWLDSLTPRGIYKLHHKDRTLNTFKRSEDMVAALRTLYNNLEFLPWLNFSKITMIGASHGAAVGVRLLTDRYKFEHTDKIKKVYALYPGLHPFETDHYTLDGSKLEIHVGELDNWTPAKWCARLAERSGASCTIYPGIKHGFSKPNSVGTWPNNPINHLVTFDDPTPSAEMMNECGKSRKIYLEAMKEGLCFGDVDVAYDEATTNNLINHIFTRNN